jgi:hypothetical protein
MAPKVNIYILLKKVDGFVKAVPIDPKSRKYKEWVKFRAEAKKEIKDVNKILALLDVIPASAVLERCHGIPLQKQIFGRIAPCWKIPEKQALAGIVPICHLIPTKQAVPLLLNPAKRKG